MVAVEGENCLVFQIIDEQAFYGAEVPEPAPGPELRPPQRRFALPRLRPTTSDPDDSKGK